MRKVPRRRCYSVKNKKSKRVMAKCTSKKKAIRQMRLLRGIKYNKTFAKKIRSTRKLRK
jgi:hypothetical protein